MKWSDCRLSFKAPTPTSIYRIEEVKMLEALFTATIIVNWLAVNKGIYISCPVSNPDKIVIPNVFRAKW